jgi:hypothetical protein
MQKKKKAYVHSDIKSYSHSSSELKNEKLSRFTYHNSTIFIAAVCKVINTKCRYSNIWAFTLMRLISINTVCLQTINRYLFVVIHLENKFHRVLFIYT